MSNNPLKCKECDGCGVIPCIACHGKKVYPIFPFTCPYCNGSGVMTCSKCYGKGHRDTY